MTRLGFLLASAFLACSGSAALHTGPDASAKGAAGGSSGATLPTGGVTSQGGAGEQGGAVLIGGTVGLADAATLASDAGTAWDDACDLSAIWSLLWVRDNAQGSLVLTSCGPDNGSPFGGMRGQLVFDGNGQIVEDTNYFAAPGGPGKSEWLAQVAGYRWPCLAGSSLVYTCVSGGD